MTETHTPGAASRPGQARFTGEPSPRDVVIAYAAAKGAGDIDAALAVCHPEAVFETMAFQAISRSAAETRVQTRNFLAAFPDYGVEFRLIEEVGDLVLSAGTITATMQGPLAGIEPTGARYELPFACHWSVRDGLIVHEQFFFDFNQMCEQLGLDVREAAERFRYWRTHLMGRHEQEPRSSDTSRAGIGG